MKIPTLTQAEAYLTEAAARNPGPWEDHSRHVAAAAQAIAQYHPQIDPEAATIMGLLHDIGRREGVTGMRHMYDGYIFLTNEGFADAARICLTHSFSTGDPRTGFGRWDTTAEEYAFVEKFITGATFTVYDRLFQLCDALALPEGCCLLEKRFIDVVLRHGFNDFTLDKWRATFEIKAEMEAIIGRSIYSILPNVAAVTFGFDPAE